MRNSEQPRRQWTGFTSTVKLFLSSALGIAPVLGVRYRTDANNLHRYALPSIARDRREGRRALATDRVRQQALGAAREKPDFGTRREVLIMKWPDHVSPVSGRQVPRRLCFLRSAEWRHNVCAWPCGNARVGSGF